MPDYWENPANPGVQAPVPQLPLDSWAARRASHLAGEIVRAETHLLALQETAAKLERKGAEQGVTFTSKLEENARQQAEAHAFYHALRAQAKVEFPNEELDAELEAAARHRDVQVITIPDATPMIQKKRHWWNRKPSPVTSQNAYAFPSAAELNAEGN